MENEPLDKTFVGRIADKSYLANKADRKVNTDILSKKLDELKPLETIKVQLEGIEIATLKGDIGEPGHTPTDDELLNLIKPLIPEPIKGEDGKTPTQTELKQLIKPLIPKPIKGTDGVTPTKEELVALITPLIPEPIKGVPGKDGKSTVAKTIEVKNVKGLNEVLNEAGNNFLQQAKGFVSKSLAGMYDVDIKNPIDGQAIVYNASKGKWVAGAVVSSSVGTGFELLPATGTVDGNNASFTFTSQPTYVVSDGVWYQLNAGFTGSSGNITMSVPPQTAIWGFV